MIKYRYTEAGFALSDEGVHLLRSGYNYETIPYHEIVKVSVQKASPVRSPLIAFAIGILLTGIAILQSYRVYQSFNDPTVHTIYIESIVVVVLPLLVGIYMLYVSLNKEMLLIVYTGKITRKLSIKQFEAMGQLPEVERFLSQRLGTYV